VKGFTTKAIHGSVNGAGDQYGSLRVPVYDSVAFEHESSASLAASFAGRKPGHIYSRITNPTVQDFERKIQLLAGGMAVLAVSSGMAAIFNTIMTLGGAGQNIVTSKYLFGNTLSLFEKTFAAWGLQIRYVAMTNLQEIEENIDADTCAVFLESITNPQLEVADCAAIGKICKTCAVPLVLDNTLMTPYLFNSKAAGVDIEIISTTKYISGGATTVGGVIIDNGIFDWSMAAKFKERAAKFGKMSFMAVLRQEVYRNTGACLSPHNAYMQSLGLETMALRIDKSCQNAMGLAEYLTGQAKVESVNYPGLDNSPFHDSAKLQFDKKYGGVLTFDLANKEQCFSFMDALKVVRRATNINDNKTLILHPASTIFAEFSEDEKRAMSVSSTMLRLSAGIEDYDDLLEDLQRGVAAL
jgi:O-acetylhomoserine (thiol)-lyase